VRVFYLRGFVVFLVLTALIAAATVLLGEYGAIQGKILASSFSISAASICAMSCAVFIEQRSSRGLGMAGIAAAIIAVLLLNAGLWLEVGWGGYWQTVFVFITIAIGLAHGFLLQLPRLRPSQRRLQIASGYAISASVALICAGIISPDGLLGLPGYIQVLTLTAIAVVLLSILIPVQARINHTSQPRSERLTLEPLGDDVYRDVSGQRYAVKRLEPLLDSDP